MDKLLGVAPGKVASPACQDSSPRHAAALPPSAVGDSRPQIGSPGSRPQAVLPAAVTRRETTGSIDTRPPAQLPPPTATGQPMTSVLDQRLAMHASIPAARRGMRSPASDSNLVASPSEAAAASQRQDVYDSADGYYESQGRAEAASSSSPTSSPYAYAKWPGATSDRPRSMVCMGDMHMPCALSKKSCSCQDHYILDL